ncbi:response regulator [Natronogracilivirgula saccharolytica]|uniref:Response regulator n=2 Tax=Natronogracilivirga saccharolytica TaxID=2812953 RepID=A0A8J7RNC4_9BACT|nr:response regulator [Natronogracilivirga saccharolytica]
MYPPITITSRVELFTRKNARAISPVSNALDHESFTAHRSGFRSPNLKLVDLQRSNGNNGHSRSDTLSWPETKNSQGVHKFKALHIEDDDEIRYLVRAFLKNYVDLDPAVDAQDAFGYTSQNRYDFIITDINLGDGPDGIEATRKIKEMTNYSDIPVIAATANAGTDIRNKCKEVGMDAFLLKPFMKKDLINTIDQVMNRQ